MCNRLTKSVLSSFFSMLFSSHSTWTLNWLLNILWFMNLIKLLFICIDVSDEFVLKIFSTSTSSLCCILMYFSRWQFRKASGSIDLIWLFWRDSSMRLRRAEKRRVSIRSIRLSFNRISRTLTKLEKSLSSRSLIRLLSRVSDVSLWLSSKMVGGRVLM
jgi:hypothetical protein